MIQILSDLFLLNVKHLFNLILILLGNLQIGINKHISMKLAEKEEAGRTGCISEVIKKLKEWASCVGSSPYLCYNL